jgi:nucleotide-binding universal stress UspA family protein
MYKKVLVATDGSETATQAVVVATELAKTFGATLHVANVYKGGRADNLAVREFTMAYPEGIDRGSVAATRAESAASYARSKGVKTKSHAVQGDAAEQIVALAADQKIDLIVVGNKGMRGAKRVLGSVPNTVAHRATCAVLIVNTT